MSDYSYTCINCLLGFKDISVQRQHFKSDFHLYNLKRKQCQLVPISYENFKNLKTNTEATQENHQQILCTVCKKNFSTKSQYDNHVASKKHKEKALNLCNKPQQEPSESNNSSSGSKVKENEENKSEGDAEIDSDVETVDSDEWFENPVDNNNCLFCDHHSRTMTKNLKHMTEIHSFFIPYVEYCTDIKGLLAYLGQKIVEDNMCLWCPDNMFGTLEAVRNHMLDKCHTKMLFEGETLVEYTDYYDFTISNPDVKNPLDIMEIPDIADDEFQLVLPSGTVLGHRSLERYYKQSSSTNKTVAVQGKNQNKLRYIMSMYKGLGWMETQKEAAKQKAIDVKYMERARQKYSAKIGVKANKLQTHFRAQVMQ